MEQWQQDNRRDVVMVDIDQLVPKDHLLRKIEKVMDYDWLYERLSPYYCHGVGRDGTDPVVLIKMVLIQHLFGIPSLRQTYREIQLNVAYRWFLGYSLLDRIPHFATVSYAFCKRFPSELPAEIFEHILNKAINNRAVDPSAVFIDGTHIKASANKKKFQKEQVAKTAKIYEEQLRKTERSKALYAKRKESIERVFGDAKEKHAMRYTHHRGLARVTNWVTLKFACINLKKLATWNWNSSDFFCFFARFFNSRLKCAVPA